MAQPKFARQTAIRVQIWWNGPQNIPTDETAYFVSANGAHEYFPPAESYQSSKQIIQQMTLILRNQDGRYSPWVTNSVTWNDRYNGGAYHKKVRLSFQINGGSWQDIFTGYIKSPGENLEDGKVKYTIWDLGEMMRDRYSTIMLQNYLEHDAVIYYLQLAGLVDGIDFVSPAYALSHPGVNATIDQSTQKLPYTWLDDEPIWDELVDIAQATGARLYVDTSGMIHYEKGWHWAILGSATPLPTISEDHISGFEYSYDDKAFYDEIIVGYSPRLPANTVDEIWKQSEPKIIQPGQIETVTARYKNPSINVKIPVAGTHYKLLDMSGSDVSSNGAITVATTIYAQQMKIAITNGLTAPILLWSAKLIGQPIEGQPTEQVEKKVDGKNYNRRLEVRNNFYIQPKPQAENIRDFLIWWYSTSKPTLRISKVRGEPAHRIGARITLRARGIEFDGILIRVKWDLSIGDGAVIYSQDLTAIENVFAAPYFLVGSSTFAQAKEFWF